jgi:hypothetical protein
VIVSIGRADNTDDTLLTLKAGEDFDPDEYAIGGNVCAIELDYTRDCGGLEGEEQVSAATAMSREEALVLAYALIQIAEAC